MVKVRSYPPERSSFHPFIRGRLSMFTKIITLTYSRWRDKFCPGTPLISSCSYSLYIWRMVNLNPAYWSSFISKVFRRQKSLWPPRKILYIWDGIQQLFAFLCLVTWLHLLGNEKGCSGVTESRMLPVAFSYSNPQCTYPTHSGLRKTGRRKISQSPSDYKIYLSKSQTDTASYQMKYLSINSF